jgi:hypothetical protein
MLESCDSEMLNCLDRIRELFHEPEELNAPGFEIPAALPVLERRSRKTKTKVVQSLNEEREFEGVYNCYERESSSSIEALGNSNNLMTQADYAKDFMNVAEPIDRVNQSANSFRDLFEIAGQSWEKITELSVKCERPEIDSSYEFSSISQ